MRLPVFLALAALLTGCAQFSADGGMAEVASGVRQEIAHPAWCLIGGHEEWILT